MMAAATTSIHPQEQIYFAVQCNGTRKEVCVHGTMTCEQLRRQLAATFDIVEESIKLLGLVKGNKIQEHAHVMLSQLKLKHAPEVNKLILIGSTKSQMDNVLLSAQQTQKSAKCKGSNKNNGAQDLPSVPAHVLAEAGNLHEDVAKTEFEAQAHRHNRLLDFARNGRITYFGDPAVSRLVCAVARQRFEEVIQIFRPHAHAQQHAAMQNCLIFLEKYDVFIPTKSVNQEPEQSLRQLFTSAYPYTDEQPFPTPTLRVVNHHELTSPMSPAHPLFYTVEFGHLSLLQYFLESSRSQVIRDSVKELLPALLVMSIRNMHAHITEYLIPLCCNATGTFDKGTWLRCACAAASQNDAQTIFRLVDYIPGTNKNSQALIATSTDMPSTESAVVHTTSDNSFDEEALLYKVMITAVQYRRVECFALLFDVYSGLVLKNAQWQQYILLEMARCLFLHGIRIMCEKGRVVSLHYFNTPSELPTTTTLCCLLEAAALSNYNRQLIHPVLHYLITHGATIPATWNSVMHTWRSVSFRNGSTVGDEQERSATQPLVAVSTAAASTILPNAIVQIPQGTDFQYVTARLQMTAYLMMHESAGTYELQLDKVHPSLLARQFTEWFGDGWDTRFFQSMEELHTRTTARASDKFSETLQSRDTFFTALSNEAAIEVELCMFVNKAIEDSRTDQHMIKYLTGINDTDGVAADDEDY